MNVVLDTNIFVSGIHWDGSSRKVLKAWLAEEITVVISLDILEEVKRILSDFKITLSEHDFELWESLMLEKCLIVEPTEKFNVVENPDDNKFIEAAVAGNAKYIVSQDKHLLKLRRFRDIEIINPEDFLKLL